MNADDTLLSTDALTLLARSNGINTWNELKTFIRQLPYGRNKNRIDPGLVLSEKKGTCSSKHALLKRLADLNNIPEVKLFIGIYRMNEINTPGIGTVLTAHSVDFIPEAHCYLKISGKRADLTAAASDFKKIEKELIREIEIQPVQVAEFKVDYHKKFIKKWLKEMNPGFSFDQIWQLRGQCITNLTEA